MAIRLNSLYICVQNMNRAVKFYESLLELTPVESTELFTVFDIKGFRFCLFNNNIVNEAVTWGDNCLPSFEVDNIQGLIIKLESLNAEIVFPLTKISNNLVLEFKDSEGNDIEVYCKI